MLHTVSCKYKTFCTENKNMQQVGTECSTWTTVAMAIGSAFDDDDDYDQMLQKCPL